MARDKGDGAAGGGWSDVVRNFGPSGVLLVGGFALIGVAIYKGPEFTGVWTQIGVIVGGFLGGGVAVLIGWLLLPRGLAPASKEPASLSNRRYDVLIAAPMAGFGDDEDSRKAAVELVRFVETAVKRLPGVQNVHSPVLARPDPVDYENSAGGFDVEMAALGDAKRYLLILPPSIPPGTSVLVTAGIAIALKVPSVILADKRLGALPYLLDGAVKSKRANVRLYTYEDTDSLATLIRNDGLGLFGEEPR
jgi:hypothetical protein